ncbi:MAG: adenylate/guanylate cyclase domain-containing protein, partial [Solirubrobacteraceae bacterium]
MRMFVRLMRRLPADPRCAICRAPYGGFGGRIMGRLGFAPSRKNPRICSECFEKAPMGGQEMEVGILFADVRGFASLAERQTPDAVATLLNRFYATAVEVLCEHAIIDKLVGDQVMALYLPRVFRASRHTTWQPTRRPCWRLRATSMDDRGWRSASVSTSARPTWATSARARSRTSQRSVTS